MIFTAENTILLVDFLVSFATSLLLPTMCFTFVVGCFLRYLVHFTVSREKWFSKEFEKRVFQYLEKDNGETDVSFYQVSKKLLEKTYYEIFVVRSIMKRRKPDMVTDLADRVFLIQEGTAWLVKDSLKQIRYLKHKNNNDPKLIDISKNVFQTNPCFNKIFGILPLNMFNDVLNILPGLFIIGGIFGTFLGIMKALPELSSMDLTNPELTKTVMDDFLGKISFSMSTSIIGIVLSVVMSVFNTILSPEKVFIETVNKYNDSLMMIWNRSTNNELPTQEQKFDENRDPLEVLAEESVNNMVMDKPRKDRIITGVPNVKNLDGKSIIPQAPEAPRTSHSPEIAVEEEEKKAS